MLWFHCFRHKNNRPIKPLWQSGLEWIFHFSECLGIAYSSTASSSIKSIWRKEFPIFTEYILIDPLDFIQWITVSSNIYDISHLATV